MSLPSGFKTKEEYATYMREYRARQRQELRELKQFHEQQKQGPINAIKKTTKELRARAPPEEELPQVSDREILAHGYQGFLAVIAVYGSFEKWTPETLIENQQLLIGRLIRNAGNPIAMQYRWVYEATKAICEKVLSKHEVDGGLRQAFNSLTANMKEISDSFIREYKERLKEVEGLLKEKEWISEEYKATVHICNRAVDIAQKLYGWNHEKRTKIYTMYLDEAIKKFKNKSPEFQFQVIVKSLLDQVFEDMPGGVAKNASKTHRRWVI